MGLLNKILPDHKKLASRLLRLVGRGMISIPGRFTRVDGADTLARLDAARALGDTKKSESVIIALFHGPHFPIIYFGRHRGMVVITSRSKDGQILTDILEKMGYNCVRGSSGKGHGGMSVIRELARETRNGHDPVIAVDGPRGPILEVKEGILLLAKLTGRPILPVGVCSKRFYRFQSWDRFRLPIPFSKVWIRMAAPILIDRHAGDEEILKAKELLQKELFAIQKQADDLANPVVYARKDRKPRDGGRYPILETKMGLLSEKSDLQQQS